MIYKFPAFFSTKNKRNFELINQQLTDGEITIPIQKGIPRFVHNTNYATAFGEQWKKYFDIQLDSYIKSDISEQRVRRCCGEEVFYSLKDKLVLEAGCGAGRFTEILLKSDAIVASFDLSDAVEANQKNFPISDNHIIFQADIIDIPFEDGQFDVVICLGVIQHTPNPEQTIASLYRQVKPGGWLVIDHYTHSLSYYTKTTGLLRSFLKKVDPKVGIKYTEGITNIFFPLHKAVRKIYPLQAILSRISPVHSYYFEYPQLSHEDQYNWSLLDTHDSLTDWYKHFRTKKQIRENLRKLGGTQIYSEYSSHGVDARCQRPSL